MSGIDTDKIKIVRVGFTSEQTGSLSVPDGTLEIANNQEIANVLSLGGIDLIQETSGSIKTKEVEPQPLTPAGPEYVKHLVTCRCFLPQFKNMADPPSHKFVVFNELDELANVKPSFVKCTNCGIIHKVYEVGQSEITNKEDSRALETVEDIKSSNTVPDWLMAMLEKYECELPSWQESAFIVRYNKFPHRLILVKENQGSMTIGKACFILNKTTHQMESFQTETEAR